MFSFWYRSIGGYHMEVSRDTVSIIPAATQAGASVLLVREGTVLVVIPSPPLGDGDGSDVPPAALAGSPARTLRG